MSNGIVNTLADWQYDGSDSGARPDEAVSWGKIRAGAESVKVRLIHLVFQIDSHH
jgi:deoxyhypusine synthase